MEKKNIFIAIGIIALLFIIYLFSRNLGKVDDWSFTPQSPGKYLVIAGIVGGAILLGWLASAIAFIITGRPVVIGDKKQMSPKRIIGIWLLAAPIALVVLCVAVLFLMREELIPLFAVPIILLALIIWGVVYSMKKNVKIAILPIVLLPILIIGLVGFGFVGLMSGVGMMSPSKFLPNMAASDSLGFAVGGAKDINNFRQNINNSFLPLPTDITYEGLFYDYYFDTGKKECKELFCPEYSYAKSKDPLSGGEDEYLSVGLNSNIKESDFHRKKLNLVIVLDISGSMGSSFNTYYYDNPYNQTEERDGRSKLEIATQSVVALLNHLNSSDRFGMVVYDDTAYVAKPLRSVGDTDMESVKSHILDLMPQGGTNMEAGLKEGTQLFDGYLDADQSEYENRIIFLTDAMPNTGVISKEGLLGMAESNAENKIYMTFIGMGVDFNTDLVENLTKIRGANYYSVHSAKQFKERMDDEFEYMVTPLVFNLSLQLDADGYNIEKVYGSPEANEATGEIMKVSTLFPSKTVAGETKGGIIILKLKKTSQNPKLNLKVSYEDRLGVPHSTAALVALGDQRADYYENNAVRKAILLTRYADLSKNWINDERESIAANTPVVPTVTTQTGIIVPIEQTIDFRRSQWERSSTPLCVSPEYKGYFTQFRTYFGQEMNAIGDSSLAREANILDKLSS